MAREVLDIMNTFSEWRDEAQMHALYCSYDFHKCGKGRNEEFMLDFWKRAIFKVLNRGRIAISVEDMVVLMDRSGQRPLGMENIIVGTRQEALAVKGELGYEEDLLREAQDHLNNSWVNWIRKKAKLMVFSKIRTPTSFFFSRNVLSTRCKETMDWVINDYKFSVVSKSVLVAHFASREFSEREMNLVLAQMQLDDLAIAHEIQVGMRHIPVFKFRREANSSMEVLDRDVAVLTLNTVLDDLSEHIRNLETRKDAIYENIRRLIKAKNRDRNRHPDAKALLREAKAIDRVISNHNEKRLQIESQVLSIMENEANFSTISALKMAIGKQKQSAISLEEVEKLREDMEDVKTGSKEVEAVLYQQEVEEDDDELMKELNDLEEIDQMKALDAFPKIPNAPQSVKQTNPRAVDQPRAVVL